MKPEIMVFVLPIFALLIPIAAIIMGYFEKKAKMQVVEKAIEKGVPLNGFALEAKKQRLPYRSGMVLSAVGIGIALFGFFMGFKDEEARYALMGMSAIPILIGAALLINDKINYARIMESDEDKSKTR